MERNNRYNTYYIRLEYLFRLLLGVQLYFHYFPYYLRKKKQRKQSCTPNSSNKSYHISFGIENKTNFER